MALPIRKSSGFYMMVTPRNALSKNSGLRTLNSLYNRSETISA